MDVSKAFISPQYSNTFNSSALKSIFSETWDKLETGVRGTPREGDKEGEDEEEEELIKDYRRRSCNTLEVCERYMNNDPKKNWVAY